jgi:type II secretory pathway pseudopilin PulG
MSRFDCILLRRRHAARRRAYTLIETISSIVVIGIIGTLASRILLQASQGDRAASTRAQLAAEVSMTMDRIVREVRDINRDPGGGPAINAITPASLQWQNDCALTLLGTNLELAINGAAGSVLQTDITSFALTAFDDQGNVLSATMSGAACTAIRRVEISVTATRDGSAVSLRTRVFTRAGVGDAS